MKKIYLLVALIALTISLIQAAIDQPIKSKRSKYAHSLRKAQNKRSEITHKGNREAYEFVNLRANEGGDMYAVDCVAIVNSYDEILGFEKYYYDSKGNMIEWANVGYYYYEENEEYIYLLDGYGFNEFNEDNKLIMYEEYFYDVEVEDYVGSYKEEYQYNSEGNEIEYIGYYWDYINWEWLEDIKIVTEYTNDIISNVIHYYHNHLLERWEQCIKNEHVYDSSNILINLNEYIWNDEWIINYKDTLIYENGLETQWIRSVFEQSDTSWKEIDRELRDYDENDNLIAWQYDTLNASDEWLTLFQESFEYDNRGNEIKYIYLIWDQENEDWFGTKREYTYDENDWIIEQKYYEWYIDVWVYLYNFEYFWKNLEDIVLSDQTIKNDIQINVYPNPVISELNVSICPEYLPQKVTYNIVNSIGCIIGSGELVNQNQTINFSNYHKGMFFIQFKVGEEMIIRKVIKQ